MSENNPRDNKSPGINEHLSSFPDSEGHFGVYGGRFVSEILMQALDELEKEYERLCHDDEFQAELKSDLANYVGRASPLYFAKRLTEESGGAKIFLKREDLNHTLLCSLKREFTVIMGTWSLAYWYCDCTMRLGVSGKY